MALIAFLSFILGRPVFFLFLFLDGNNGVILFHKTSGTSYSESTPVISDITIDHKRVQYGLALSYKYSMAKTQLISITFRIGSKLTEPPKVNEENSVSSYDTVIRKVGTDQISYLMSRGYSNMMQLS